jgi:hypothetical protein
MQSSLQDAIEHKVESGDRDTFMHSLDKEGKSGYLELIPQLPQGDKEAGTRWLQGTVDRVTSFWHPVPT